jgi:hypothetical protein
MERPPFKNVGAWLACGTMQLHLTVHPPGSFGPATLITTIAICFPH